MKLTIFNSLTKKKEPFEPLQPGKISVYACGMTVYDYCHIGHARYWVAFDMIIRYLRARGFEVTYVKNITDIDDKIINRANENREDWKALTERFINAYREDERALNVLPPDHQPRATQFMPQIIALIQKLIDENYAYVAENGDVCFDVRRFKDYGKLSHRDIDQLRAGARVEINEGKRDPLDFTLWKLSKPNEPKWNSPWGEGRPGWHIECSAMASTLLGQPFDIHGGGLDLKFPHHENEIAQSEAAEHKPFVKTWIHSGLLQIDREKMSKSVGNIIRIRDALEKHDVETLRYFFLSGHYRSPISYSEEQMTQARSGLERLYIAIRGLPLKKPIKSSDFTERFHRVMDDDFNTPEAFAIFFELAREINRFRNENQLEKAAELATELKQLAELFGILQLDPEDFLRRGEKSVDVKRVEELIQARNAARAEKEWALADRLRSELKSLGVVIEDSPSGTTWRRE